MSRIDDYSREYAEALDNKLRTPEIDATALFQLEEESGMWLHQLAAANPEVKTDAIDPAILEVLKHYLEEEDKRQAIYTFLTPVDEPLVSAPYFLYGASGTARARYATRLYDQDPSPIVVSDGDIHVQLKFLKALKAHGIPASKIIKENKARNYIENAYYNFRLLDQQGLRANGVNVVTESLTALRGKLATEMFAPEGMQVASTPVEVDPDFPTKDPTKPETWFKTPEGLRNALRELIKLHVWQQAGLITFKPYEPKS